MNAWVNNEPPDETLRSAARVMQSTPNVHDLSIFTYYTTRTVKANAFRRPHGGTVVHQKRPRTEAAFDVLHLSVYLSL